MNSVAGAIILISFLLSFQPFAQQSPGQSAETPKVDWSKIQRTDDIFWSGRTKIPLARFQRLRRAAGIADGQPSTRIKFVNSSTLPHERILFVSTFGQKNCVSVGVYEEKGKGYREMWSVGKASEGPFCGPKPCTVPNVSASKKGEVAISVPYHGGEEIAEACNHVRVYSFHPSGKSYQLADQKDVPAGCGLETYYQALELALPQISGATRVATLKILPSSRPGWASSFDKTPQGLEVSSIAYPREFWTQIAADSLGSPKLPSQCLELAKSERLDRNPVPLARDAIQQYIDELEKIDFTVDRCLRSKNGSCTYMFDSVSYIVQINDGRSAQVTDVSRSNGLTSENPALSNWIAKFLADLHRGN